MQQILFERIIKKLKKHYSEDDILSLLNNKKDFNAVLNEILFEIQTKEELKEKIKEKKFNSYVQKTKFLFETKFHVNKNRKYFLKENIGLHYKTGLNVLEELMRNIRGVVVDNYKMLTTSKKQRYSYKIHLLNGIVNIFQGFFISPDEREKIKTININIRPVKNLKDEKPNFDSEEGHLVKTGEDKDKKLHPNRSPQEVDKMRFMIAGQDRTGANFAFDVFNKIKKRIIDAFLKLDLKEDRIIFYKYLLANLVLEMRSAEEELHADLPSESVDNIKQELPNNYKIQNTNTEKS